VQEVINKARQVTGRVIPVQIQNRRPWDPAILVADSQKARRELGSEPRFAPLDQLIAHAWGGRRSVVRFGVDLPA
jgi:UDP-glucose 4-epimerase